MRIHGSGDFSRGPLLPPFLYFFPFVEPPAPISYDSSPPQQQQRLNTENFLKPNIASGASEGEPDEAASEEQEENGGWGGRGGGVGVGGRARAKSHLEGDGFIGVVKEVTEAET